MGHTESTLLNRIIIELRQLIEVNKNFIGGSTEATLQTLVNQTDQLETLLADININTSKNNYQLDIQEKITDGTTDINQVVAVSITLIGDGGTINGVSLPNGSTISASNEEGGFITNSIPYSIPTSTGGKVLITYNKII